MLASFTVFAINKAVLRSKSSAAARYAVHILFHTTFKEQSKCQGSISSDILGKAIQMGRIEKEKKKDRDVKEISDPTILTS